VVEAGGVRPHGRRRPGQRGRGGQGRGRAPGPRRGRLRHDARGGGGRRHVAEAQDSRADTLHRQETVKFRDVAHPYANVVALHQPP